MLIIPIPIIIFLGIFALSILIPFVDEQISNLTPMAILKVD